MFLYSKYLHLALLAPLLNLSAAGCLLLLLSTSDPLALSLGHCLGLSLSLSLLIPASSFAVTLCPLLFPSSACGGVYV